MPRPSNPEVRSRLLSAGGAAIYRLGFNGSAVQDITASAGIPKGSFYNYFENKDAFAVEVLEDFWLFIERSYGPILYDARIKPLDRITKYFHAIADFYGRENFATGCLIGNMSIELSNVSENGREKLNDVLKKWGAALAGCLREAQTRNEFPDNRDVEETAAALIDAWEGAVMRGKVEQARASFHRFETFVLPRLLT